MKKRTRPVLRRDLSAPGEEEDTTTPKDTVTPFPFSDPSKTAVEIKEETLKRERARARIENHRIAMSRLVLGMRSSKPGKCRWLSKEDHILPEIVNIVYTINFQSEAFKTPLDMIRMVQYLPNCKFRPPSFPAATLRIWPITALVYQEANAVIIKTTSPGEALYQSHVLRQLLEQIPFIMKTAGQDGKLFCGTLEGRLGFNRGKIDNIVGSGMLYQDGVHLANLLHAEDAHVDFDPGAFPNAIYRNTLPDGTVFCSNIASTQKVVTMGVKSPRALYKAYKMTSAVVNDFEGEVCSFPLYSRHCHTNLKKITFTF
jgi:TATA-box binding protein (TBP) (component of TFIID and TFIIIB)